MRSIKCQTALVAIVFFGIMSAQANASQADVCEEMWTAESSSIYSRPTPDYDALAQRWGERAPMCQGTIAYEARLAMAYVFAKRLDKSREILASIEKTPSPYRYLVELAQLLIATTEISQANPSEEDISAVEARLRAFIRAYPNVAEGRAILGGFLTGLDRHAQAIEFLEGGLRSKMNLSGIYRNLAVSYAAVGRFAESLDAADMAFEGNRAVLSDPYFAYALAKSNAATGKLAEAEKVLRLIAAKKPEVRRDPEFKEAVEFVVARMK